MKQLISENTGISLSILGAIVGAVVWISFVAAQTYANASSINTINQKLESIAAIQSDTAVIRSKIESIEQQLSDKKGR